MELFYSNNIDGGLVTLSHEESGHCVKVLRHRRGDAVDIIDGEGSLLHCELMDADPREAVCRIVSAEEGFGSHPYDLAMAVCPTKNADRFEWFAEKATETGLDRIVPVIGDHSERKIFKTERIKRLVLSATKQSLKAKLPEVCEPVSVKEFIENEPEDRLRLICYCFEQEEKRVSVRQVLEASSKRSVSVLIGPEGDFSEEEVRLALARGWQPVHLGPSRLRTETAALTAATAVYLHFLE